LLSLSTLPDAPDPADGGNKAAKRFLAFFIAEHPAGKYNLIYF